LKEDPTGARAWRKRIEDQALETRTKGLAILGGREYRTKDPLEGSG
jgi:hypothetical protein